MSALTDLLAPESIRLAEQAADREEAVRRTGAALVEAGAVEPEYVDSMLERERSVSTWVGEGVAIPHGTLAGKDRVLHDALVVLRFPEGVDWDGGRVEVCVGIAAAGTGHIGLLSRLAGVLLDSDRATALRAATTPDEVYDLLAQQDEE